MHKSLDGFGYKVLKTFRVYTPLTTDIQDFFNQEIPRRVCYIYILKVHFSEMLVAASFRSFEGIKFQDIFEFPGSVWTLSYITFLLLEN